MKRIETNNKGVLEIETGDNGVVVTKRDSKNNIERRDFIHDGDLVMLLNYWKNCKEGLEKSSYIT